MFLGSYFNSIGIADSSIYYTQKSLTDLQKPTYIAKAYRLIGSGYRRTGKINNAIEMFFKSLKISEDIQYLEMISKVKSDLGILYAHKQEYDKALQFFKESAAIAYDDQSVYGNYVNIGGIYFLQKKKKLARNYFLKAYELMPKDKDPKTAATLALNLGSLFYEDKKYITAIAYFDQSKKIADTHGFMDKSLNAIAHKAMVVDVLGNSTEAIEMLTTTLQKAIDINNLVIQRNVYDNMTTIYNNNKNYKAANASLIEFYRIKDTLQNSQQKREITELEVKYETAEKEKEILVLKEDQLLKEAEISKQRLLKKTLIISFIIILIPIIGLSVLYYQKLKVKSKYNRQKEEIHRQKISTILKEQELKLANIYATAQHEERFRIARELHDSVGGNLAAIKLQLVARKEDQKIEKILVDQIDNVYEQVREISHNLKPGGITNALFTTYVNDYINTIEKVTEPTITFAPHPVDKVDRIAEDYKIEIFKIIQELLTNALKHAKAKVIEVCLNVYQDTVEIIFEDDGVGFDLKKGAKGIGLQNVRDRLSTLSARMDIDSTIGRGTAIRIKIPIKNDNKAYV